MVLVALQEKEEVGIKKIDLNKDYLINYEETDKLLYKVKESGKNSFIIE